jgi:hypothetical protein
MVTTDDATDRAVERALGALIGLRLAIARRAADMAVFHFGAIRAIERGTAGEFALHVQCPWRIDGPEGIVTGRLDLFEPVDPDTEFDPNTWDYDNNETLQDQRLHELMGDFDPDTRSFINQTRLLEVTSVESNGHGAATLHLSGGFRLILFPAGTRGEDWRLFRPRQTGPHFVISGGAVVESEDDAGIDPRTP